MNIIIFGASGMVGQGVLRECLKASDVAQVLSIGRSPAGTSDPKLTDLIRADLFDYDGLDAQLSGYDACFFCLGVSSVGMDEARYTRITHDLTLAAAEPLARLNPGMTFVFVSGAGADATEQGRTMWARVKGRTENALQRMPFKAVYVFRPGLIQPLDGIGSKTAVYRAIYGAIGPLLTGLRKVAPGLVVTTRSVGRAMLEVVRRGAPKAVLESRDLVALGQ